MEPFLQRLANTLLDQHPDGFERVAVVLPGRRAGLYLQKYLARAVGRTFWSPEMLDIGGTMERFTGMRQGTSMELLFLLHRVHYDLVGPQAGTLDEFLQWAPTSLRDMSEVDAHLIDLQDLYRDLRAYHEIEEWSFRTDPLSEGQERQVQQWRTTGELHGRFGPAQLDMGFGTSGFLARQTAMGITNGTIECPWDMVWFAGLNALEPATTKVIQQLKQEGRAKLAWDADTYYLHDNKQEAGHFLRRSAKELGLGEVGPLDAIRTRTRRFHAVSVPDRASQTRFAAQYLAELDPAELAETVVVLTEEDLLMPLLEALPPDLGPLNVTMGIPVESLPIHGLTEAFLQLHAGVGTDGSFRSEHVERLLLHPFLHQGKATIDLLEGMRTSGRYYLDTSTIIAIATRAGLIHEPWASSIFTPLDAGLEDLHGKMNDLLAWAARTCISEPFIQEQLYRMARIHHSLQHELERAAIRPVDLRTYVSLRTKLLREERIGFFGEPLQGAQIMGTLETRAIDHRRVIVLGAQEGSLPRVGSAQSWIPFDIRRFHELPLPFDTASVSAYHFDRLMQMAEDVHLVYGAEGGSTGTEASRFIGQWMHEIVGHSATTGGHMTRMAGTRSRNAPAIVVNKTEAVMKRLSELAARGFSPSALGTYLRCPLDLWMIHGSQVRQANELDERLGSDVLGNAVHRVLEEIHRPWLGRPLDPDDLRNAAGETKTMLKKQLASIFPRSMMERGHIRLRIEMAARALSEHLLSESVRSGTGTSIVLAVELNLDVELYKGVRLRGRCDRVEMRDGMIHLLDMKTGSVDQNLLHMRSLDRDQWGPRRQQALQLLIYSAMYLEQHPDVGVLRAGIIPLQKRSLSEGLLLKVAGGADIHRSMLPEIKASITALVHELMDPERPFKHDPDSAWCSSCVA